MLVVPGLAREVVLLRKLKETCKQLQLLRSEGDNIENKIHHLNQLRGFIVVVDWHRCIKIVTSLFEIIATGFSVSIFTYEASRI
ncbi:hypothetical protein Leryth_023691 [Lithospermum erythrorhizon]|nr:hypothetical protein Leryth_023691 [Lithospermum erythrorhizon]